MINMYDVKMLQEIRVKCTDEQLDKIIEVFISEKARRLKIKRMKLLEEMNY